MAGHYPLNKQEESEIFATIEHLAELGLAFHLNDMADFEKDEFKDHNIMRLPSEYAFNDPVNQVAVMVGKFNLKSMSDQHPSITQNIDLEVHLMDRNVVNIFWVA